MKLNSETQHTPGPWQTVPTTAKNAGSIRMDVVSPVTTFAPSYVAGDILPEDARLIAAAPDLLEALAECITDPGAHAYASEDYYKAKQRLLAINNTARAAIAKATGQD